MLGLVVKQQSLGLQERSAAGFCYALALPAATLLLILLHACNILLLQQTVLLQADVVERNEVTSGQMWVLLLGQILFLLWVVALDKVQVSHKGACNGPCIISQASLCDVHSQDCAREYDSHPASVLTTV